MAAPESASGAMPTNLDALKCLGEDVLNAMHEVKDDVWTEWLNVPFEQAAGPADVPLTRVLKEAGAEGNVISPAIKGGRSNRRAGDLLRMVASPTAKDDEGNAPIHLAASVSKEPIGRTPLIKGAHVDEPDRKGYTPLHLVSASGDDVSVRTLLAAGACPRTRHGVTDLCALDFAALNGNVGVVKTLLERGADINARGRTGRGSLHWAAEKNRAGVIQLLARDIGVQLDCADDGGMTPLHVAAREGHLAAFNALLSAGADISRCTNVNHIIGFGPLSDDCSVLHLAAHAGHVDILKTLVRREVKVTIRSRNDLAPLHHAAAGGKLEAMRFLLDEGADINAGMGWKPIHAAVEQESLGAVRFLARNGANLSAEGGFGESPLAYAAKTMKFDMVNALLNAGATPNPRGQYCPVMKAAVTGHERSEEMLNLLLRRGANVDGSDVEHETALHSAMRIGTIRMVNLLVKAGAAVDAYDLYYTSPLHAACDVRGSQDINHVAKARILLRHGAPVDPYDEVCNTPLHYASVNRSAEMVDLLLRAGADESIRNDAGKTPADRVKTSHLDHAQFDEWSKPVLRLLDGAPADRVWRRRGLFVLCRVLPDRVRLAPERTRVTQSRAAKKRAESGGGCGAGDSGELTVATIDVAFRRVVVELVRFEEEGIFRNVICFL